MFAVHLSLSVAQKNNVSFRLSDREGPCKVQNSKSTNSQRS